MRLRDRFYAAVQTFREAPDLQSHLTTAEYERSLAEQMLEVRERECEELRKELMKYLTAYCFDAVTWEIVPGTTYEKAVLGEVDASKPEYQRFERQLYQSVLERMGFDGLLVPEQAAEQAPAQNETAAMTM